MSAGKQKAANPAHQRSTWRQQEQALVERWTAATERYRVAHGELSAHRQANGGASDETLEQAAEAARTELETLRRQVARLKREFLNGARY